MSQQSMLEKYEALIDAFFERVVVPKKQITKLKDAGQPVPADLEKGLDEAIKDLRTQYRNIPGKGKEDDDGHNDAGQLAGELDAAVLTGSMTDDDGEDVGGLFLSHLVGQDRWDLLKVAIRHCAFAGKPTIKQFNKKTIGDLLRTSAKKFRKPAGAGQSATGFLARLKAKMGASKSRDRDREDFQLLLKKYEKWHGEGAADLREEFEASANPQPVKTRAQAKAETDPRGELNAKLEAAKARKAKAVESDNSDELVAAIADIKRLNGEIEKLEEQAKPDPRVELNSFFSQLQAAKDRKAKAVESDNSDELVAAIADIKRLTGEIEKLEAKAAKAAPAKTDPAPIATTASPAPTAPVASKPAPTTTATPAGSNGGNGNKMTPEQIEVLVDALTHDELNAAFKQIEAKKDANKFACAIMLAVARGAYDTRQAVIRGVNTGAITL